MRWVVRCVAAYLLIGMVSVGILALTWDSSHPGLASDDFVAQAIFFLLFWPYGLLVVAGLDPIGIFTD
jgi:hypothetical protein